MIFVSFAKYLLNVLLSTPGVFMSMIVCLCVNVVVFVPSPMFTLVLLSIKSEKKDLVSDVIIARHDESSLLIIEFYWFYRFVVAALLLFKVFLWFQIAMCQIVCFVHSIKLFVPRWHFLIFHVCRYSKPSLSRANLLYIQFISVSGFRECNWFINHFFFFFTQTQLLCQICIFCENHFFQSFYRNGWNLFTNLKMWVVKKENQK